MAEIDALLGPVENCTNRRCDFERCLRVLYQKGAYYTQATRKRHPSLLGSRDTHVGTLRKDRSRHETVSGFSWRVLLGVLSIRVSAALR